MKSYTILFMIILGLSYTACNPGRLSTAPNALTTSPPTRTAIISLTSTAVLPTNTPVPPSPTQIPTHTSTPTTIHTLPSPTPTSTEDPFANRLLPDLQTRPPTDLRLIYNSYSGRALIRFTNSIWNSGPGKLELVGIPNQSKDQIRVSQRVFTPDLEIYDEYEVGEFKFHEQHDHWHLEQFAIYEVWLVDEKGVLVAKVSSGGKISYCVMDTSLVETDLPAEAISTHRRYTHCEGKLQGLSVGWVDVYKYHLPGQWAEVNPLKDGLYALVSTVNPDQRLYEEDIDNNSAVVYFEIRESRLEVLDAQFFEDERILTLWRNLKP